MQKLKNVRLIVSLFWLALLLACSTPQVAPDPPLTEQLERFQGNPFKGAVNSAQTMPEMAPNNHSFVMPFVIAPPYLNATDWRLDSITNYPQPWADKYIIWPMYFIKMEFLNSMQVLEHPAANLIAFNQLNWTSDTTYQNVLNPNYDYWVVTDTTTYLETRFRALTGTGANFPYLETYHYTALP